MTALEPDPRPRVVSADADWLVVGGRCPDCGYVVAGPRPRCPACRGAVAEVRFGPGGTVWSATVVRIPVPGRPPPYAVAYVDLDDGPRILAHTPGAHALAIGSHVRLAESSPAGDAQVVPA